MDQRMMIELTLLTIDHFMTLSSTTTGGYIVTPSSPFQAAKACMILFYDLQTFNSAHSKEFVALISPVGRCFVQQTLVATLLVIHAIMFSKVASFFVLLNLARPYLPVI
jgi:hypothetical protein